MILLYYHFAVASQCSDGADITFIVDNRRISLLKFRLEKEFIKKTMAKLVQESSQFNAAIVLYNQQATVMLYFTQKFVINHFFDVIDSLSIHDEYPPYYYLINPIDPHTRIDQALQVTSDYVFGTHEGYSLKTAKIAVLLTHSSSRWTLIQHPLKSASESLMKRGVRLLIVGISAESYQQELHNITDDKDDLIMAKGFSTLPEFEDVLFNKICSAVGEYQKCL